MGRRPLVGMVLAWFAIVLVVATVTFVVVDRAGRGVGQASAARTVAPAPSASSSTPGMPGTASPTPSPSLASVTPSPTTSSEASPAPPSQTSAPQPATGTASFPTAGGTVVATCKGNVITLGSITVRDGWRFERESEGGELEVKFKSTTSDVDDVKLKLVCVSGTPTDRED